MTNAPDANSSRTAGPVVRRPFVRRLLGGVSTLLTGGLAVGMVAGGVTVLQGRAAAVQIEEAAPLITVAVRRVTPETGYTTARTFLGQVEARQETALSFELAGRLAEVTVDEGDHVRAGDVIARLDTAVLANQRAATEASRAALSAQGELARLTAERQRDLTEKGHAAQSVYDQARLSLAQLDAQIAEVDAGLAGIDIQLGKAVLRAPFDGVVGIRSADIGTTVAAGQPVVDVQQDALPRVRVGLPEDVAATLRPGETATFSAHGETWPLRFDRLRADIDPATRTRVALFTLTDEADLPLYGEAGSVVIAQRVEEEGVWLPVGALREGVRGLWTVLTVSEPANDGSGERDMAEVGLEAVELLHVDGSRAFVRGTFPPGVAVIETGQHRVTPGQIVALAGG